jgi:hypothetical protein
MRRRPRRLVDRVVDVEAPDRVGEVRVVVRFGRAIDRRTREEDAGVEIAAAAGLAVADEDVSCSSR